MIEGLVSVITTTYNSSEFIGRTIETVLAQSYQKWELVITDDCSSDNSCEVVRSYAAKDDRIKLFQLSENGGPGISRNYSISKSSGQYIAFLDSDDCWLPDKLERELSLMKEKQCGIVYSSYLTCDEDNRLTGLVRCRRSVSYKRVICDDPIGFLTLVYDRKITGDVALPTMRKRQDWGFKILLLRKCPVAYGVTEPLAVYKIRANSVSRNKMSLIRYNVAVYHEVAGFSIIGAYLMFCLVFMPTYVCKKFINRLKTLTFRPEDYS